MDGEKVISEMAISAAAGLAATAPMTGAMTQALDMREFQSRLQKLDSLLAEVDRFTDPKAPAHTRKIVQAVLDLHGEGLSRMLEHLAGAGDAGRAVLDACAADEVVRGLLLLHGLHPVDLATRVREALGQVRPYLRSHGGNVELLGITDDGTIRLRLQGSCHGCPSSAMTLKQTIEEAILDKAPDASGIEVEGEIDQQPPAPAPPNGNGKGHLPLPILSR